MTKPTASSITGEPMGVPELSVILATPDRYETVRETVKHLERQTARDRLEVVFVAPPGGALGVPASGGLRFRIVEVADVTSLGAAYAAGVREASAPIVVLAEDHSYPSPGWAEALIEAHRQPWVAVGPVVSNGNPESPVAWADFMIGYSRWAAPVPSGEIHDLPGHNSSYKRAVLLEYDAELEMLLEAASVLHWEMRAKGHRFYLEPEARTRHLNHTLLLPVIQQLFFSGRVFAAARARRWPWSRRVLFTIGAAAIPWIRLRRILRDASRTDLASTWMKGLPLLVLGLIASAAGETAGYALGVGGAMKRLSRFEFHRDQKIPRRNAGG